MVGGSWEVWDEVESLRYKLSRPGWQEDLRNKAVDWYIPTAHHPDLQVLYYNNLPYLRAREKEGVPVLWDTINARFVNSHMFVKSTWKLHVFLSRAVHAKLHSKLRSITPVATKVHVMVWGFVVLTWMHDTIKWG